MLPRAANVPWEQQNGPTDCLNLPSPFCDDGNPAPFGNVFLGAVRYCEDYETLPEGCEDRCQYACR